MLRIFHTDGTVHFSHLKKLALSGVQYLHAVNTDVEPTRDMLIGTGTHKILLGHRPGAKEVVRYEGDRRAGKKWDEFLEEHPRDRFEILTAPEWAEAEAMAASVRRSPVAQRRLEGARFEVPFEWIEYPKSERPIRCSTSGVDIIPVSGAIGDLKTARSTHPETFKRQATDMLYPQQLAFYRRGARANGYPVPEAFILGVDKKAPHEVVELKLTEDLLEMADRSITLWLEELRRNMLALPEPESVFDWPGYAETAVQYDLAAWQRRDHVDDDGDEEAAA